MNKENRPLRRPPLAAIFRLAFASLFAGALAGLAAAQTPAPAPTPSCNRTVKADVVAFDQVITYD